MYMPHARAACAAWTGGLLSVVTGPGTPRRRDRNRAGQEPPDVVCGGATVAAGVGTGAAGAVGGRGGRPGLPRAGGDDAWWPARRSRPRWRPVLRSRRCWPGTRWWRAWPGRAWELADAWVEPGRMAATAPAVTTPAMPTVTVTARRWPWLRCRANTAARTSDRRWFMKNPRCSAGLGGPSADRPDSTRRVEPGEPASRGLRANP